MQQAQVLIHLEHSTQTSPLHTRVCTEPESELSPVSITLSFKPIPAQCWAWLHVLVLGQEVLVSLGICVVGLCHQPKRTECPSSKRLYLGSCKKDQIDNTHR